MKLQPGLMLAERYRISHRVGEGGMGQVWAATHVVTGRRVAIKRLFSTGDDLTAADHRARARFIREAQAACAVEHPHVVAVIDFLQPEDEPPLLVMELLEGETLSSKLAREQALGLEETAGLLRPVVSAVGTAHARGIIHRDLKPANIFLHRRGGGDTVVKVLDFGIAKWVTQTPHEPDGVGLRTETGSTLGTPCYMAPEQALGERVVTHAVDVWSIGIMLYECLSGARPVEGENAAQMVLRLLNTGIIPIERVLPNLPPAVTQLIGRMLSRDPARRPKDLREVSEALGRYTSVAPPDFGEPARATNDVSEEEAALRASSPAVVWVPSTQPETAGTQVSPKSSERPQPKSGLAQRTWGLAALAALLLGVVGLVYAGKPDPNASQAAASAHAPHPIAAAVPAPASGTVESPALAASSEEVATRPVALAEHPKLAPSAGRTAVVAATAPKRPAAPQPSSARGGPAPTAVASPIAAKGDLPHGATCERSRDCASRLCVAFACE